MPNNYVLLETIALTQSAASVTFDNLPTSGYTDLKIVASARTDRASVVDDIAISFNGSTTSFSGRELYGDGASAVSISTARAASVAAGANATASTFGNSEIYIPNYTGSANKSFSVDGVQETNGTTAYAVFIAGLWSNTAAITSVGLSPLTGPNFVAGSTFSLYGVAAFGTTPVLAPKADGGNIVANDGTYWYHAFLASGTFTPQTGLTADVLVVAGGGGAGDSYGAGGGGGGLLAFSTQSLTTTGYTCTVGAGGAAGVSSNGTVGADSQFAALTLVKGGGFGAGAGTAGNGGTGGSGGAASGGSGSGSGTGGSATSGQGNAGGSVTSSASGAGGGGAGSAGSNSSGNVGGTGGAGSTTYASWSTATGLGYSQNSTYYFAGGGAGAGISGNGGQANGSTAIDTAGQANTGQGGGADGNSPFIAKAGGSGVVIIRYPIA